MLLAATLLRRHFVVLHLALLALAALLAARLLTTWSGQALSARIEPPRPEAAPSMSAPPPDAVERRFEVALARSMFDLAASPRAGLQSGDVVVAVNGYGAEDPVRALELFAKLRDQPTLEVSLLRRGAPVSLTVSMPVP